MKTDDPEVCTGCMLLSVPTYDMTMSHVYMYYHKS